MRELNLKKLIILSSFILTFSLLIIPESYLSKTFAARCSHRGTTAVLGYGNSVTTTSISGCGCSDTGYPSKGWVYFQPKGHEDFFVDGLPNGAHNGDFVNNKLTAAGTYTTCRPGNLEPSCYVYEFPANANPYTINRDNALSRAKQDGRYAYADFCPGHDFHVVSDKNSYRTSVKGKVVAGAVIGGNTDKLRAATVDLAAGFKMVTPEVETLTVPAGLVVLNVTRYEQAYPDYNIKSEILEKFTSHLDEPHIFGRDLNKPSDLAAIKKWVDAGCWINATLKSNNKDNYQSHLNNELGISMIPASRRSDSVNKYYFHENIGEMRKLITPIQVQCYLCHRYYWVEATLEADGYYTISKFLDEYNTKTTTDWTIDTSDGGSQYHRLLELNDILTGVKGDGSANKYPFMSGRYDPYVIWGVCGYNPIKDRPNTARDRKYCGHVEAMSYSNLVIQYHLGSINTTRTPTAYGRIKKGDTTKLNTFFKPSDLNGTIVYGNYRLTPENKLTLPDVELADNVISYGWQNSPIKSSSPYNLKKSTSPDGKWRNYEELDKWKARRVHLALTGYADSNGQDHATLIGTLNEPDSSFTDPLFSSVPEVVQDSYSLKKLNNTALYNASTFFYAFMDEGMGEHIENSNNLRLGFRSNYLQTDNETNMVQLYKNTLYTVPWMRLARTTLVQASPISRSNLVARGAMKPDSTAASVLDTVTQNLNGDYISSNSPAGRTSKRSSTTDANTIQEQTSIVIANTAVGLKDLTSAARGSNAISFDGQDLEDNLKIEYFATTKLNDPTYVAYNDIAHLDLPAFSSYNTASKTANITAFGSQRRIIDAVSSVYVGADALSSPMTYTSLYANLGPLRYIVAHQTNMDDVNDNVRPDMPEGSGNKARLHSELMFEDSSGKPTISENMYAATELSPTGFLYNKNSEDVARDWGDSLALQKFWYAGHYNIESTDASEQSVNYRLYSKPHLVATNDEQVEVDGELAFKEWYYIKSDAWEVVKSDKNDYYDKDAVETYSAYLNSKDTLDFGATIGTTKDLCSSANKWDEAYSETPKSSSAENMYGKAVLYAEWEPKKFKIRYKVNDDYAKEFDTNVEASGADNYFQDKNYYDGKTHYFDATKSVEFNYHDKKQPTSGYNRGSDWDTSQSKYPKAYKQGYYIAGWEYYDNYGVKSKDADGISNGFYEADASLPAFAYYPKSEDPEENICYLYAVWKPYSYKITYTAHGKGESGADLSHTKTYSEFYLSQDGTYTGYDMMTNTVGTWAELSPRKQRGESGNKNVDELMTAYPQFTKFGYYINSWEGSLGTTNSTEAAYEEADFKKDGVGYTKKVSADWNHHLNAKYYKPKSNTYYSPEHGQTTANKADETRARSKYWYITEDIVIPGNTTHNHLMKTLEKKGHNLEVTYASKWDPILYNVKYLNDSDTFNMATSSVYELVTGNYQFGKTYQLHKNPTSEGCTRETMGGASTYLGWCLVDKDSGLHPHYKAGSATNVTEVSNSTEESSIGTNFYTKSKTLSSWAKSMGSWGSPYLQDHHRYQTATHGNTKLVSITGRELMDIDYVKYFSYIHGDIGPAGDPGHLGQFPIYAVWDDKVGWGVQDIIWSYDKMWSLIQSHGGSNSENAKKAVMDMLVQAEVAVAEGSGNDREGNDTGSSVDAVSAAKKLRIFEFDKVFDDIVKMCQGYNSTSDGRATATFELQWYPDGVQSIRDSITSRKLMLTDSNKWRNLQIARTKANGGTVTINENIPWAYNFYRYEDGGRPQSDFAVPELSDLID